MKREDILINVILTIFVGISTPFINEILKLDFSAVVIINFLIVSLFWFGSYIKEIDKVTKTNLSRIKECERSIGRIKEDLNINNRLTILEAWKEKMNNKKGQINIVDLIKIIAIIIIAYLILRAFFAAAN